MIPWLMAGLLNLLPLGLAMVNKPSNVQIGLYSHFKIGKHRAILCCVRIHALTPLLAFGRYTRTFAFRKRLENIFLYVDPTGEG